MNIALRRLFIMSETLQRILKRNKPKAEIVENMTRSFFKQSDSEEAVITIKPNKMTRSQAQNRLYWMIIEQIRKETFNSKDAIHDHCREEYLTRSTEIVCNKERTVLKSTTELNTKEMGEYIDDVIVFAETDLGIKLQLPDDWRELISYTSSDY